MKTIWGVNLSNKCADRLSVAIALSPHLTGAGWLDIDSAPKDGTELELRVVHINAAFAENPAVEGSVDHCRGKWIEHNGGGWTWNGLCGHPCQWRPIELLNPPMENSEETGNARAAPAMTGSLPVAGAPTHQTVIDGCVVHGDAPLTGASRAAMRKVIAAAKTKLG